MAKTTLTSIRNNPANIEFFKVSELFDDKEYKIITGRRHNYFMVNRETSGIGKKAYYKLKGSFIGTFVPEWKLEL